MTPLDIELVPLAQELLAEYGKAAVWRIPQGVYDPIAGALSGAQPIREVPITITPPQPYEQTYEGVKGSLRGAVYVPTTVLGGDMECYVAAKQLSDQGFVPPTTAGQPQLLGSVKFDNEVWGIVSLGRVYTGEQIALYKMQLRQ